MKLKLLNALLLGVALTASGVTQAALILDLSFDSDAHSFSGSGTVTFDGSVGSVNIVDMDLDVLAFGQSFMFTDLQGRAVLNDAGVLLSWDFFHQFEPINNEDWRIHSVDYFGSPYIGISCGLNSSYTEDDCSIERSLWGASSDVVLSAHIAPEISKVPEPSTLAIFALGIAGLASRRVKK